VTTQPLTSNGTSASEETAKRGFKRSPIELAQLAMLIASSKWKLRRCQTVGAWPRIYGKLLVDNGSGHGAIRIGDRFRVRGTHLPVELATLPGGVLQIGDGVYINSGVSICAQQSVQIGNNCAIGNNTLIMDTDFHNVDDHRQGGTASPVVIEDDVWIAARVTILKGVRIGRGAVVAAGAVVTKDVAPRTLVGGVPARLIRNLDTSSAEGAK
jgi:acetyltransferase-like isoleucine patch superfamily enzyme